MSLNSPCTLEGYALSFIKGEGEGEGEGEERGIVPLKPIKKRSKLLDKWI
jgi:hypothetical protein